MCDNLLDRRYAAYFADVGYNRYLDIGIKSIFKWKQNNNSEKFEHFILSTVVFWTINTLQTKKIERKT